MRISKFVQAWFYGGTSFGMLSLVGVFAMMAMKPTKRQHPAMTSDGMVIAVTNVAEDGGKKRSPLETLWSTPGNKGAALGSKVPSTSGHSATLDRATEEWFEEASRK